MTIVEVVDQNGGFKLRPRHDEDEEQEDSLVANNVHDVLPFGHPRQPDDQHRYDNDSAKADSGT